MKKFLALLLVLALAVQLASAGGMWDDDWEIKKCIKRQRCWTKGNRAVCGVSPRHKRVGFPNRCYYACTNQASGGKWHIKYWYTPDWRCKKNWDWKCSDC